MNLSLAILIFLVPFEPGKKLQHLNYSSSDAQFTVVCDAQKNPPFKVLVSDTDRAVLTFTREQLGNRSTELVWAPDDPVLVVIFHRPGWDRVRVWRFSSGHPVDCSPNSPHDSLSLGATPWFASNKLHLKGHERTYTLTVGSERSHIE